MADIGSLVVKIAADASALSRELDKITRKGQDFGERSRQAHESYARTHGIPFAIVPNQRLALDVDRPDDLVAVLPVAGAATRAVLEDLGYPQRATAR